MAEPTIRDGRGRCSHCGGLVVVLLARAWCLKLYAEDGCGGFWQRRGGRWRLVPELCGLFSWHRLTLPPERRGWGLLPEGKRSC